MILHSLKLELQVVVSHLIWELETKLGFSGRTARALKSQNSLSSPGGGGGAFLRGYSEGCLEDQTTNKNAEHKEDS
jgi:hypothetical protein